VSYRSSAVQYSACALCEQGRGEATEIPFALLSGANRVCCTLHTATLENNTVILLISNTRQDNANKHNHVSDRILVKSCRPISDTKRTCTEASIRKSHREAGSQRSRILEVSRVCMDNSDINLRECRPWKKKRRFLSKSPPFYKHDPGTVATSRSSFYLELDTFLNP
jgi:ribosomal protein S17